MTHGYVMAHGHLLAHGDIVAHGDVVAHKYVVAYRKCGDISEMFWLKEMWLLVQRQRFRVLVW